MELCVELPEPLVAPLEALVEECEEDDELCALATSAETTGAGLGEFPTTTPGCPNCPVARAICAATAFLRAAALRAAALRAATVAADAGVVVCVGVDPVVCRDGGGVVSALIGTDTFPAGRAIAARVIW